MSDIEKRGGERTKDNAPRAVQLCHETLVWIIPQLDKFPRSRRFTVGERIEKGLLEVLGYLVEASYSRKNKTSLKLANRQLAVFRHVWRVSFELNNIGHKRYQYGAGLLLDFGRQMGGWLNHDQTIGLNELAIFILAFVNCVICTRLMEALQGKGFGSDDQITIKELAAYVEDVLPDRTYNKWGYEQVPQSFITGNDFPIGLR